MEIDWVDGPNAGFSSDAQGQLFAGLLEQPGAIATSEGDAGSALAGAARVIETTNEFPYLAHAAMEPLNCTVWIKPDGVEIWSPTQFQTIDQQVAASVAGVKPEQVKIHTMLLGGGFGRKATPTSDFTFEAVHVAKAVGNPVKVIWTREDDMRGYYYRSRTLVRTRVGLDAAGMPTAWTSDIVNCSIARGTGFEKFMIKNGVDSTSVEGLSDLSYAVPNLRVTYHEAPKPVPVLWWRSVGNSYTGFVKETVIDQCAVAAGKDPVDYRIALLAKEPRQQALLRLAAIKAGWGQAPKGHFQGVAVHASFESIVAQVIEVSVDDDGTPHVHRVVCAVDPGMVINPEIVRAQLESAVIFGLSQALHGKITFKDGRVEQGNFNDYPVVRMNETPPIETYILESGAQMGGIGEPGVPPVAPALANAIAAATGKRIYALPIDPALLKKA